MKRESVCLDSCVCVCVNPLCIELRIDKFNNTLTSFITVRLKFGCDSQITASVSQPENTTETETRFLENKLFFILFQCGKHTRSAQPSQVPALQHREQPSLLSPALGLLFPPGSQPRALLLDGGRA